MTFHNCPTYNRALFAGQDGLCRACRPVAHDGDVPLTEADVQAINAPLLADLIGIGDDVSGATRSVR